METVALLAAIVVALAWSMMIVSTIWLDFREPCHTKFLGDGLPETRARDAAAHGSGLWVGRRRLRVLKLRGVAYRDGFHDFRIATGGMIVFPAANWTGYHGERP